MPDVEVDRPDRQRDERMGEHAQPLDARGSASTGRRIGPGQPGDEAERREVAEDHVLQHVDEEEVLLAERVDRRVEREHDERDPGPEARLPPDRRPAGRAAASVRVRRK